MDREQGMETSGKSSTRIAARKLKLALRPVFVSACYLFVLLVLRSIAAGQVHLLIEPWHLPVSPALTGAEWSERTAAIIGRSVAPTRVTRPMLVALGVFMPILRELRETLYQWQGPWVVDDTKVRAAFGVAATDVDTGIRRTLEWFDGQGPS